MPKEMYKGKKPYNWKNVSYVGIILPFIEVDSSDPSEVTKWLTKPK